MAAAAAAAAAADVDIDRGAVAGADELDDGDDDACVVCLFGGCCVEAPALDRDVGAFCRNAAKKVERKKGRWEDMLGVIPMGCCVGKG